MTNGGVYFLFPETFAEDANGHLVKIGMSKNPVSRAKAIESMSPHKICQLWVLEHPFHQPSEMERYLHETLAKFRTHGEWFCLPTLEWWKCRDNIESGMIGGSVLTQVIGYGELPVGYFPTEFPPSQDTAA